MSKGKILLNEEKNSLVTQISWPLLKLSPCRGNSVEMVEGRCGKLYLPTHKKSKITSFTQTLLTTMEYNNFRNINLKAGCVIAGVAYHSHVHGVFICITVHRHRANTHFPGSAHHTTCNLSSIGNQNFLYPCHP